MPVVIEEQIFGLQITMNNHVTMAIINAGNDLLKEFPCLRFLQFALFHDVIEKFTATDELKKKLKICNNLLALSKTHLHDHEDIRGRWDDLIELNYVRMSKQLQILNFTTNFSHNIERFDLLSIEDFNSYLMLCDYVFTDLHFSKGSI